MTAPSANGEVVTPMFVPRPAPLLPTPPSSRPRPPTTRRKTLAPGALGKLRRSSARLAAKNHGAPAKLLAEKVLCRRLGILREGDNITEEAISKFTELFRGQLPAIAVSALRTLFRLDCDLATAVEDALIEHGGADGLDHEQVMPADGTAAV